MNWHFLTIEETEKILNTSPQGLKANEARERLRLHGENVIEDKRKKSPIAILLGQFKDVIILILFGAAVISGIIGDVTDTIIILVIVFLNALVGFIQEYRAEKAMEALKKLTSPVAYVFRDGQTVKTDARFLVPGDLISLEAGHIILADVRFLKTYGLKVDESMLTGESHNVEKKEENLTPGNEYALGDMHNMGFKGTHVTFGRALAYVVQTGKNTEIGKIAGMLGRDESATPLQKRLSAFGKRLSAVVILICALIFFMGWIRGENPVTMLLTSISLAVAAIPEALPAMVTITLALGARKMVKQQVIIRKLSAVEALGSATYICSDKTGTLTENKMKVEELVSLYDGTRHDLPDHQPLLFCMALNNDVMKGEGGEWLGEATEVALAHYALQHSYDKQNLENTFKRIAEIPFDSVRKCMTTIHKDGNHYWIITKGAAERIKEISVLENEKDKNHFDEVANRLAEKGYRVLAFGIKKIRSLPESVSPETIEHGLLCIGMAGMWDPPRPEAKEAIKECLEAGITPVMITGDHRITATAIAKQIGIYRPETDEALTGKELEQLTEAELRKKVRNIKVYARVNPEQKLKIVDALQAEGEFVAMTGDGVNDAPALKVSNIGISMGINGTEVAKEASHMVLLDDNFASIVRAIRSGRVIFDNIVKFIKYTMTSNFGEIISILLAPFFLLPIPLQPIHILWINLITDGLPGLALAMEPEEKNVMKRRPRKPNENIFNKSFTFHVLFFGFLMGIVTLIMQALAIHHYHAHWQTMAFSVLCFSQLGHVLAIRSEDRSLFDIGIFSNLPMLGAVLISVVLQLAIIYVPFFNNLFHTRPLSADELGITLLFSTLVFWAVEAEKWFKRKSNREH
ncbi:MAG: cation-translocating P-type ATPase [Bacteroidia bacterium]|nr:cation-translocating P-type ATPase [Bacteroidia bacterium]